MAVTATVGTYQCAETHTIARGVGTLWPSCRQPSEYWLRASAFIGLPWPTKMAGMRDDWVMRPYIALQPALHPAQDVRARHGPRLASHFTPGLEHHHGRDTADGKLGTQLRLGLRIHLGQPYPRLQRRRRLGVLRCHRQARTAPWRPEIHHQRNVIATDMGLEAGGSERHGMRAKQRLMALAALRLLGQAFIR